VISHPTRKAQGFLATKFGNFVSPILARVGRIRDEVPAHVDAARAYAAGHWLITEPVLAPGQVARDILPAVREATTVPRRIGWLLVGIVRFVLAMALWPVTAGTALADRLGRRPRLALLTVLLLPRAAQLSLGTRARAAWVVVVLLGVVALVLLPDGVLTSTTTPDHHHP